MNDMIEFYDLVAEITAKEWYSNDVLMPTISDFLSLLPKCPHILDLGCGPGYESMRLSQKGASVVGVDLSKKSIIIAREKNPNCRFEVMDFRHLDISLGRFDGVFASGSLIHVDQQELGKVIKSVHSILNDGGYFLCIVQKGEGIREYWPEIQGKKLRRVIYLYSEELLKKIFENNGFAFVREGYLDDCLNFEEMKWGCYIFKKT